MHHIAAFLLKPALGALPLGAPLAVPPRARRRRPRPPLPSPRVARVLIVGGGCRGRALATELRATGHAVRATTRDPARTAAIAEAGAEPYVGDPDRIATLMEALTGVTILCWLLGTADGATALHGPRLRMLFEKLVDTHVRGVVYEAAGTVDPAALAEGRAIAQRAHATWQIPLAVIEADPARRGPWLAEATAAVERLLV